MHSATALLIYTRDVIHENFLESKASFGIVARSCEPHSASNICQEERAGLRDGRQSAHGAPHGGADIEDVYVRPGMSS